jgi:hypothetical protein
MIAGKGVKLQRIIDSRPGDPPILLMARAGTGQISLARNGFENHRAERDTDSILAADPAETAAQRLAARSTPTID